MEVPLDASSSPSHHSTSHAPHAPTQPAHCYALPQHHAQHPKNHLYISFVLGAVCVVGLKWPKLYE